MCRPTTPDITVNVSGRPRLSLALKTHSLSLTHTHKWNLKDIIKVCCRCDGAAKPNLYAGGPVHPGQTQRVVTSQSEAVNHQSPLSAACVCVCVCRPTHWPDSLRRCCACRSSTTAAGWRPGSPTGRSSRRRCRTRSEPDKSPRRGGRTRSGSACLQERDRRSHTQTHKHTC